MKSSGNGAVPILMYHSVGRALTDWSWSNLTTPAEVFEDHLRALSRAGYRSATLREWHAHVRGERPLAARTVVLTFDDGYLDNWVYAAPLLERYGYAGTVLVTPEFVHPGDAVRPTLRDVWGGHLADADLPVRGFMSWEELRRLLAAGLLDVQCHAMTHTWYPVSDEVVDFHHPADGHYWLDWNAEPESKPRYLERLGESRVPYGVPVYAHEKSLACRRYFPDPREAEHFAALVAREGGPALFARSGWREHLRAELASFRASRESGGRPETDAEYRERLGRELVESKRVIASMLATQVEFLVWPGGGYNKEAMEFAREHYAAVTVSSGDRWRYRNRPGENPGKIVRRGVPSFRLHGRTVFAPGAYLVDFLDEFRGRPWARRRRQVRKLLYVVTGRAGVPPA
jgi:peptidoglycan/xylan/chitin deacetylase (PgdA/CDA1 family)